MGLRCWNSGWAQAVVPIPRSRCWPREFVSKSDFGVDVSTYIIIVLCDQPAVHPPSTPPLCIGPRPDPNPVSVPKLTEVPLLL
jgi:hypothetical protein